MKFELLSGTHSNKTGHFSKGDIITSNSDLAKLFVNKFQRRLDLEGSAPVAKAPAAVVAPKAPSAPVVSEETDDSAATEDAKPAATPEAPKEKHITSKLGTDVTANFPEAKDADFAVFADKKGKHFVAEPDAPNKALNKKALKEDEVNPFIKEFLANA